MGQSWSTAIWKAWPFRPVSKTGVGLVLADPCHFLHSLKDKEHRLQGSAPSLSVCCLDGVILIRYSIVSESP